MILGMDIPRFSYKDILSFSRFATFKVSDFSDTLKVLDCFKALSSTSFQLPKSLNEAAQLLVVLLVKEAVFWLEGLKCPAENLTSLHCKGTPAFPFGCHTTKAI